MKKFQFFILALLTAAWLTGVANPAEARKNHQQLKRIYNGIQKGSITQKEFMKLNQEQHRIRDYRLRALADGHMSPKERRKLNRMIETADRNIYRAKHNRNSCSGRVNHGHRR